MSNENQEITRTLNKPYAIRNDSALTLPGEVLALLQWELGDMMSYRLDLTTNSLIVSKATQKQDNAN